MAKYFPTYQSTFDNYLAWRLAQQRLTRPSDANIASLIPQCGWVSTSGPTVPLALYHREHGDALGNYRNALHDKDVVQVRTVRGFHMLVEKAMVPYAIAANQRSLAQRWRVGWRVAGIDETSRQAHVESILGALGSSILSDAELAAKLPKLAEETIAASVSKKAGNHKTLLGWLLDEIEEAGLIHGHQGTWAAYATRFPNLPAPKDIEPRDALVKVAEQFFSWGNVASTDHLAWWLGIPVRDAEAMMYGGDMPLAHLMLSGATSQGFMMHARHAESLRSAKASREGPVFFLPARDPFYSHVPFLLDRSLDENAVEKLFQSDVNFRPLVLEAGKPVATWHWSEDGAKWEAVGRMTPALRKKINTVGERLTAWVREKGVEMRVNYGV